MNTDYTSFTHRTAMVIGADAQQRLQQSRVMLIGLGGVGSWCAEGLVRSGVSNLTIVDSDIVCATNINRQAQATAKNIGQSKARELGRRLLDINPGADIDIRHAVFDASTCDEFALESRDYVIDAIDSIANKTLLIEKCVTLGVSVFSSMGAAAKTDPSKIRTGLLSETTICPLARIMRSNLRKRGITTDIPCVYSIESPVSPAVPSLCGTCGCECSDDRSRAASEGLTATDWCEGKKRINGAMVHITAIFGFTLAGMVIQDIVRTMSLK